MQALERHDRTRFDVLQFTPYDGGDKSRTTRIGSAFVNKDGSINILLDALPAIDRNDRGDLRCTVQLREPKPRDDRDDRDDNRGRR